MNLLSMITLVDLIYIVFELSNILIKFNNGKFKFAH
jgi:hypothetical protein